MEHNLAQLYRKLVLMHRANLQNYLKKYNIYLGQHRIFFELEQNPNITLTQLTTLLDSSKESISLSVKRLEQAGYITKKKDERDKRKVLLELSEKGLETSQVCRKDFNAINEGMFSMLEDEEKENLAWYFKKMIEGLEGEI